jgi:hypothetical protein
MKILYLSCHSVLEWNEVSLFNELGYEIFSPGAYVEPRNPGNVDMRPIIDMDVDPVIREQYNVLAHAHPSGDGKANLSKEFVDNFDCIIVMHIPDWIINNWGAIKHKTVIWRTIGQSLASTEASLAPYRKQGLKVVRYSPREVNIPNFIGQDALIRFYQDPEQYKDWNGKVERVITFSQSMEQRGLHCGYKIFEEATRGFPRALFGPGNNQPEFGMGKVSYSRLLNEMKNNRVYFYTGTHPASYTLNFIESWMLGIPIVGLGPKMGNSSIWRDHDLYEVSSLVENGVTGFISDNTAELHNYIHSLLNDYDLAKRISKAGRAEAIRHFGKDMIKRAWDSFLKRIVS